MKNVHSRGKWVGMLAACLLLGGVVFAEFDLSITKTEDPGNPSTIYSGDVISYILTIDLTDTSSGASTDLSILDYLNPNMIFTGSWSVDAPYSVGFPFIDLISSSSPLEWTIYSLGQTDTPFTIRYDVQVIGTGMYTNTGEVVEGPTDPGDTNMTNNTSAVTITVEDTPITGQCGYLSGLTLYDLEGDGDGYDTYKIDYPAGTGLCVLGNTKATDDTYSGHLYEWICRGEPDSPPLAVSCQAGELYCGDGLLQGSYGEICDDGNQDSGDGCSSTCQPEILRMTAVASRGDEITFTNYGTTTIDLTLLRVSAQGITTGIGTLPVVSGSLVLVASGSVTVSGFALADWGGDLALLYATGSESVSGTMIDYVQRGSGGNDLETVAGEKLIWTVGEYLDELDPYTYIGDGSQTGLAYWSDIPHVCGDGVIYTGGAEGCDDGDLFTGDGCSDSCQIEAGWQCTDMPSICTDVDECSIGNGGCEDTCTNLPGSFVCSCGAGYILSGDALSCDDADECIGQGSGNNCSLDASCSNTIGSFTCSCNSGFTGDGVTCTDENECLGEGGGNNCSLDATCTNTQGSFTCGCNSGFTGDGVTCNDIDECALSLDNCSVYATCSNTSGSFTCGCDAGFTGDGVTCTAVCGDGLLVATEECDDSGVVTGDGCDASCQFEIPTCDIDLTPTTGAVPLLVTGTELLASGSVWVSYDQLAWGDGTIDGTPTLPATHTYTGSAQYTVTLTVSNSFSGAITSTCTGIVQVDVECGNSLVESGEECDDGNASSGDGCDMSCQLEIPTCDLLFSPTTGNTPLLVTGNEITASGLAWVVYEQFDWDDGTIDGAPSFPQAHTYTSAAQYIPVLTVSNLLSGSVTSTCTGLLQVAVECGNSIQEAGEECDDGNIDSGDGCSATCDDEGGGSSGGGGGGGGGNNDDDDEEEEEEHYSAPSMKRYSRARLVASIMEQIKKRISIIEIIKNRNSEHAVAPSTQPQNTASDQQEDEDKDMAPVETPTTDLFGRPVTSPETVTPVVAPSQPIPVVTPSPLPQPDYGDTQSMSPDPEVGTWYKTGTPKEQLIQQLMKRKNQEK